MIIKNITLYNYRLYEGHNEISFDISKEKNIYLISGENGFGKTTFLHSLIWCLYGRLIIDVEAELRKDITNNGYNAFLNGNLNNSVRGRFEKISDDEKQKIRRQGYTSENEHFKSLSQYYVSIEFADVVIPSLPCTTLKIIRTYDMIMEKEFVEILIDGAKNELTAEIGSEVFINDFVLNKDIARFFFFDSEQIVTLAETNTSIEKRRLCSAYNEVLGVRKYEDLRHNLENVRLRFRKKSSDVDGRERLLDLLNKQECLEKEVDDTKHNTSKLEIMLSGLRDKDNQLQMDLMREGNNITIQEIQRIEKVIKAAKIKDADLKNNIRHFLDYAPFAICGKLLSETKVQLDEDFMMIEEKNLQESKNIVVADITSDLILMLQKVPMSLDISLALQNEIQTILEKYKGTNIERDVLLSMPEKDYNDFVAVYNNITTTYKTEFERLADDYRKNKQIMERNSRRLSNINSKENDELIKKIRAEKNDVESEIYHIDQKIRNEHEKLGTLNQVLSTTNKQISELSKRVSLDDSSSKKDEVAEQLMVELSTFLRSLKMEKKYSLERRIKSIMNTLMHKEDFIGRVEVVVDGEDMDIDLYSMDNLRIKKDSLSKGEQQLYATSILKALVDESGIQFPVFIDSPLQKFDKSHAKKIITEFYPRISKQVILFPLLYKELTKEEYDVMKPLINATYLIKNDTSRSYLERVPINDFVKD